MKSTYIFIFIALFLLLHPLPSHSAPVDCPTIDQADKQALLTKLKDGKLNIVLRHTTKTTNGNIEDFPYLEGCIDEYQVLNQKGLDEASTIGKTLLQLDIPVDVHYSEFCRTCQTAIVAFGPDPIHPDKWLNQYCCRKDDCCKDHLSRAVTYKYQENKNKVYITHNYNIKSIRLDGNSINYPKGFGVALVFDPHTRPTTQLLACLMPNDWPKLLE